jgi:hypothetical protein
MRKLSRCKDCSAKIYVDVNMVMVKDEIWKKICDDWKDVICDHCMEKRLGRAITPADFKGSTMGLDIIPCNQWWLMERADRKKKILAKTISYADSVKGLYRRVVESDTELFLFEIAQQANSGPDSKSGAEKTVGKRIVKLALELFPFAKLGDKFKC